MVATMRADSRPSRNIMENDVENAIMGAIMPVPALLWQACF
jgi:hypothetical protein